MRNTALATAAGLLVAASLAAPAAAAPTVTATRLPVPAGTTSSNVFDINNSGVAVGTADVGGVSQALRWTGSAFTRLPGSTAQPEAAAARITDAGHVVGSIATTDNTSRTIRHWAPGGTTVDCTSTSVFPLGVSDANERGDALVGAVTGPRAFTAVVCHPDGTTTPTGLLSANGIGDDGRVAGVRNAGATTNFQFIPVAVAADGTPTDLPVPAGQSGAAYDVGPAGSVVGALGTSTFGQFGPVFTPRTAVAWIGGRMIELGGTEPADTGRAVSRTGDIIGTTTTAAGQTHAFLWRAGRLTDLGSLGGGTSAPTAVNDRGQVVGFSTTASGATHAFLWSGGRMIDLGAPGGASSRAADVNNAGQVVGSVTKSTGESVAYRWTVRDS